MLAIAACGKDQLSGPQAEVKKTDVKLDLPAVPAFDLPPQPADGSHTIKELRVKGKKLFDTDITVHGFITWAYDCVTAIRKPGETDKQVQDRIDSPKIVDGHPEGDPTLCERPKFYIGDDKATPAEKSLWVVDVPRYYNRQELKNTPDRKDRTDPLKCEPHEDPKKNICGPYAVGDEVVITGTFKTSSPHSERNSDGLLVYKKMKNITQNWETPDIAPPPGEPGATPGPTGPTTPPGATKPSPADLVHPKK
ncbi:MAG TPA: hypothetical protein VLX92_27915 [Kofleriaceae bacterium]|nr:hypothetical protein [Kofleriaceae bacterium]